jgi:succinate dehydrogenase / fumarate reductase flavoprotein subunit
MGGIWVDYELMTTIPGLFAAGEANFSDHGANRLGASALMQGLADGYFVLPYTVQNYLSGEIRVARIPTDKPEFEEAEKKVRERLKKLLAVGGSRSVDHFHKELGRIMWENVGMGRTEAGLKKAIELIRNLRTEFWKDVKIPGGLDEMNTELEKANRVVDFLELAELMALDALNRNESCGGHFREEYQTEEGECLRNDNGYMYVAAWEYKGEGNFELHKEPLVYEEIEVKQRVYK